MLIASVAIGNIFRVKIPHTMQEIANSNDIENTEGSPTKPVQKHAAANMAGNRIQRNALRRAEFLWCIK